MEKQIYIHVGPGKTGSSALQKALLENRAFLKENGVWYPEHSIEKSGISYGNSDCIFSKNSNEKYTVDAAKIEKLKKTFEDSDFQKLFLSSETFFLELSALRKAFPKAIFIFYLRDTLADMQSSYNQSVKRHGNTEPLQILKRPSFGVFRLLEKYLETFCAEHFEMRYYHPKCFVGGSIFSDVLSAIDVPIPKNFTVEKINPSYSFLALEFRRFANGLNLGNYASQKLDTILQKHLNPNSHYSLIPVKIYSKFRADTLEEFSSLLEKYNFENRKEFLEHIKSEKPKPFREQRLSPKESEEIVHFLKKENEGLLGFLKSKIARSQIGNEMGKVVLGLQINRFSTFFFNVKRQLHEILH